MALPTTVTTHPLAAAKQEEDEAVRPARTLVIGVQQQLKAAMSIVTPARKA
jgi:hypothetical protein